MPVVSQKDKSIKVLAGLFYLTSQPTPQFLPLRKDERVVSHTNSFLMLEFVDAKKSFLNPRLGREAR